MGHRRGQATRGTSCLCSHAECENGAEHLHGRAGSGSTGNKIPSASSAGQEITTSMLRGIRHKESLNSAPERSSSSNSHRTGTDTARPTILGQIYNDEHCVGEATCTPREPGGVQSLINVPVGQPSRRSSTSFFESTRRTAQRARMLQQTETMRGCLSFYVGG